MVKKKIHHKNTKEDHKGKKKERMEFIKKNRVIIIFAIIGMIGGFLYWRFIGCLSGTCPVKSVWYWSTLYGGAAGVLLGSIINDLIIKFRKKKETEVE